jgi:hypothetical protein
VAAVQIASQTKQEKKNERREYNNLRKQHAERYESCRRKTYLAIDRKNAYTSIFSICGIAKNLNFL